MAWPKGKPRPPEHRPPRRKKGTPNKTTRAVKEFLSEILTQPDVQEAIRARILAGDTAAFFKAVEMVHGKPRQALEHDVAAEVVYRWQGQVDK